MRYDKVGRVAEHFEQGGLSRTFELDGEGRPQRTERGERWEYDAGGALSAFEAREQRFEIERDKDQRIVAVRTTSFGSWRFQRDRVGAGLGGHQLATQGVAAGADRVLAGQARHLQAAPQAFLHRRVGRRAVAHGRQRLAGILLEQCAEVVVAGELVQQGGGGFVGKRSGGHRSSPGVTQWRL